MKKEREKDMTIKKPIQKKIYRTHYLLVIFYICIILCAFPISLQAQAWKEIPLYGSNSDALYNYATMLARSIMFYDANWCGNNITGNNRFNWRGDCHVNDGADVTLSTGETIWLDARGGYHDAGDHIKFGITNAYAASTLGWGFYEFREEYEETGQDVWILRAIKWATDYFIKCHPEPNTFLYHVGSGDDHNFWGPPELQLDSRSPRDIIVCTPSAPASDVCGNTAAALAIMYLNYQDVDKAYAELCLEHAIQLYELGRNNLGFCDALAFYTSSNYFDDLCWGAIWLYKATGDSSYLDDFKLWLDPDHGNVDNDYDIENGIAWFNIWTHCWDAVWGGAFVVAAAATEHPAYIEQVELHLDYWIDNIDETPGGLKYLTNWGVLRYTTAHCLVCLAFYNNFPLPEYEIYRDFAASQMSYTLGSNPLNRCYLVGCGTNPPQHPHHDAAHGSDTGFLDDPPEHKHVLYGALVGGPADDDSHNDETDDYVYNEVAIDYNAGCVGALAGMRRFFGPETQPDPDPTPEPPIEAYYVEALITKDAPDRVQITAFLHNHSVHPPHFETHLSYRYFMDLSEVFQQGYDLSNITVETIVNEKDEAGVSSLIPLDELHYIYYVEVDYEGALLHNKREFQFGILFTTPQFAGEWDSSNDFSFQNLTTDTLVKNDNMPIYRSGELIWGNEPYKDVTPPSAPQELTATATGSSQINLDWQDNPEDDLAQYSIYRSLTSSFSAGATTYVGTSNSSDYADTDLTKETLYYYKVTAVDTSLNESLPSSEVSARTLTPDPDPPSAPAGLFICEIASSTINLDWKDNPEADLSKYNVYRGTASGFSCTTSTYRGFTLQSSYSDTELTPETVYYYKVTAVDTSANESSPSAETSATTLLPIPEGIRAQYRCTNTGNSVSEIRFDVDLYNDGEAAITLSDISIRYWFSAEPALDDITCTCDFADVNARTITYSFGTSGTMNYLAIGFTSSASVPTWFGGDGTANTLPGGAQTGEVQNRMFDQRNHIQFNQENDWSFDPTKTVFEDWTRVTVHYRGNVVCWGQSPSASDTIPPVLSSPADIIYASGESGNVVNWIGYDQHPGDYTISRDESEVERGTWTNDELISIGVDGLATGTYTYTIVVTDQQDNNATDTVLVKVNEAGPQQPTPEPTPTPTPTLTTSPDSTPINGTLGDVNNSNTIDIVDALLVAQYYVGLNPSNFNPDAADVNCNGNIDIVDALLIAQYYVGLISEFC
jgi:endoglucanase